VRTQDGFALKSQVPVFDVSHPLLGQAGFRPAEGCWVDPGNLLEFAAERQVSFQRFVLDDRWVKG
jgi:hypothetical protein